MVPWKAIQKTLLLAVSSFSFPHANRIIIQWKSHIGTQWFIFISSPGIHFDVAKYSLGKNFVTSPRRRPKIFAAKKSCFCDFFFLQNPQIFFDHGILSRDFPAKVPPNSAHTRLLNFRKNPSMTFCFHPLHTSVAGY